MQKFNVSELDLGISEFDTNLGAMWSDHCCNPFLSAVITEKQEVLLIGRFGQFGGKTTIELLLSMGEEC